MLMLSLRLMLIPTTMEDMVWATGAMAMARLWGYGYGGYGLYRGYYGKRAADAEPKADADPYYYGGYGLGYGYGGYGLGYSRVYSGLGYGYGLWGR